MKYSLLLVGCLVACSNRSKVEGLWLEVDSGTRIEWNFASDSTFVMRLLDESRVFGDSGTVKGRWNHYGEEVCLVVTQVTGGATWPFAEWQTGQTLCLEYAWGRNLKMGAAEFDPTLFLWELRHRNESSILEHRRPPGRLFLKGYGGDRHSN